MADGISGSMAAGSGGCEVQEGRTRPFPAVGTPSAWLRVLPMGFFVAFSCLQDETELADVVEEVAAPSQRVVVVSTVLREVAARLLLDSTTGLELFLDGCIVGDSDTIPLLSNEWTGRGVPAAARAEAETQTSAILPNADGEVAGGASGLANPGGEVVIRTDLEVRLINAPPYFDDVAKGEFVLWCSPVYTGARLPSSDGGLADEQPGQRVVVVTTSAGLVHGGKVFLGGFRDRRDSARQMHHAATQLHLPRIANDRHVTCHRMISRETQTMVLSRSTQTIREFSTQTGRSDFLVSDSADRVVHAKTFFSAAMLRALQTKGAIKIQTAWRAWCARRCADKRWEELRAEEAFAEEEESQQKQQQEEEILRVTSRKEHPQTREDFDALEAEIMAWYRSEEAHLKERSASLDIWEYRAALRKLHQRQLSLLQTLDRMRSEASRTRRDQRVSNVLEQLSAPQRWGTLEVETPNTTRAGELHLLHQALRQTGAPTSSSSSIEKRLDVLLHVKWTVKEADCALTREIVELVDREADMLSRGRKSSTLVGLRQRLIHLFEDFVRSPDFNPLMARSALGAYRTTFIHSPRSKTQRPHPAYTH